MSDKVAVVFTAKGISRIVRERGTSSWRLNASHARQCGFAVCTRNAYAKKVEGREAHHSAFLIGKIQDVVPSPTSPGRYLIVFSEFARIDIPNAWQRGDRNPVRYAELKELGIDLSQLNWEPMPEPGATSGPTAEVKVQPMDAPLTIAEAKNGLALTFGVAPEAIEITIRG